MIQSQHLEPSQWQILRDVRLKALGDTPNAFGSTLDKEKGYTENDWRKRLQRSDCLTAVAFLEGSIPVGMIVGAPYDTQAGLFAMWVDFIARKKGVGSLLVDTVVEWAEGKGFLEIRLDVADDNHPAIALYQSKGFRETGVRGFLPAPREHIKEHQRILKLE